jgi:hypothetical protein
MSRWIRGIYNAAANFNLSNALRATSVGRMGRNNQHLHAGSDQCDEHVEPCQSGESDQSGEYGGTCHRNRDTKCGAGNHCYANACKHASSTNTIIIGNDVIITANDYIERDYADYTASIRTEGQGAGARIRLSNESRHTKRSDNTARTDIEHITGIPTGVTV